MITSLILSNSGAQAEIGNDLPALTSIYLIGGHTGPIVGHASKFSVATKTTVAVNSGASVMQDGARYGHQTGYSETVAYSVGGNAGSVASYKMDALNMTNDTASNPADGALSTVNGQPYAGSTFNTMVSTIFAGGVDSYIPTFSGKKYQLVHATETISLKTGLLVSAAIASSSNHKPTSKTKGYRLANAIGTTTYKDIYAMGFVTFTEGLISAQLSTARNATTNLQDTEDSYQYGGAPASGNGTSTIIDKLNFATETNAVHSASAVRAISQSGGGSTSSQGFVLGGWAGYAAAWVSGLNFADGTVFDNASSLNIARRLSASAQR